MTEAKLTLNKPVATGRLEDFIRQQEEGGVGPVDEAAFLSAASKVINKQWNLQHYEGTQNPERTFFHPLT